MQGPPINPNDIAPMVVGIVAFVSTAAVLIFRPLTKRLGDRLAAGKEPPPAVDPTELARLRQALEDTSSRLELVEQRLDFTERLVTGAARERAAVPGQVANPAGLPPGG